MKRSRGRNSILKNYDNQFQTFIRENFGFKNYKTPFSSFMELVAMINDY